MRPNKFRTEVNNAISHRLKTSSNKKFTPYLIKRMRREYEVWAMEEGDHRSESDTYGYSDKDSIENNLIYISDRWRCAFRLRWILDGLRNGSI